MFQCITLWARKWVLAAGRGYIVVGGQAHYPGGVGV